jgi:hypothetical protein
MRRPRKPSRQASHSRLIAPPPPDDGGAVTKTCTEAGVQFPLADEVQVRVNVRVSEGVAGT